MGLVLAFGNTPAVQALAPASPAIIEIGISVVLLGVLLSETFGPIVIDYAVRCGVAATAVPDGAPTQDHPAPQ